MLTQPLTEMGTISSKIMFMGSKALPVCRGDNLLNISQPYRSPRPIRRIVLFLFLFYVKFKEYLTF
jgi:hypothetical protein